MIVRLRFGFAKDWALKVRRCFNAMEEMLIENQMILLDSLNIGREGFTSGFDFVVAPFFVIKPT